MNTSRRKLILGFSIVLGVMIASATGVLAYDAVIRVYDDAAT